MSRIDELKKQNPQYNLTYFDFFRRMDPSKTGKYMSIFSLMMNEIYEKRLSHRSEKENITSRLKDRGIDVSNLSAYEIMTFIHYLDLIPYRECDIIMEFADYMERGFIEKNDILTYKTMDEIRNAVSTASLKTYSKELESQVHKEFEDSTWVAVRPLSFEASAKYGSATKWCTTYRTEKEYFAKYMSRGVLVYFINKITGYKFALNSEVYEGDNDISFWSAEDNRVDFLQLDIDTYLLPIIRNLATCKVKNSDFLSTEQLEQLYIDCKYFNVSRGEDIDVPQVVEEYRINIPTPINGYIIGMNANPRQETEEEITEQEPDSEETFADRLNNRLRAILGRPTPTTTLLPITDIEEDCRG